MAQRKEWESEFVHPAAMRWFEEKGYVCEHEPRISDGSIPDVVARKDGIIAVGECKSVRPKAADAIKQIHRYGNVLQTSELYLFIPLSELTPVWAGSFENTGITVVGLNAVSRQLKSVALSVTTRKALRDIAFGMDATYDEAVKVLLDSVVQDGESPVMAGRRIRKSRLEKASDSLADMFGL